jgi:hypothetical protein
MVRNISVLAVLAGLFIAGGLFAQTPQELRAGNWVSGNLSNGEEKWFSFRPSGAGIVVVETSGNLDTCLEAYDASRNELAEDDDGGEDYNARVEIFAEAGKTYLFKLYCYDEDESGPYRIRASFESVPPDTERNTERSRAVPIKLGEAMPVFFRSSSESRWYRYELTRAGTLIIQTRGSLDTIMILYDARGNPIEEDDDEGEGYNALISARLNPGTVYIEIKEYDGLLGRCSLHAEIR